MWRSQKPLIEAIFYLRRPIILSPFPTPEALILFLVKKMQLLSPFSPKTQILANYNFQGPSFKPKICAIDPTFENLGGTYLLVPLTKIAGNISSQCTSHQIVDWVTMFSLPVIFQILFTFKHTSRVSLSLYLNDMILRPFTQFCLQWVLF